MLNLQQPLRFAHLLQFLIIAMVSLLWTTYSQSYPIWVSPPQMHTASHKIIIQQFPRIGNDTETEILYSSGQTFNSIPFVCVSLIGFNQLPLDLRFHLGLSVRTVKSTGFTLRLTLQGKQTTSIPIETIINYVSINYIAYSRIVYNGISIYPNYIAIEQISNRNKPRTEVHQVQYLHSLANSNPLKYIIQSNLFDMDMKNYSPDISYPLLHITLAFKDHHRYFIKIKTGLNTQVYNRVGYNRILIDIDRVTGLNVGENKDDYRVQLGIVSHYNNPGQLVSVSGIAYFVDSIFFGLSMFQVRRMDLSERNSIFSQITDSSQRISVDIQYLVVNYRDCPSNLQSFDTAQGLCFIQCQPYFYNVSANSCAACHSTCHTCFNSDIQGCKSCTQGWHRQLQNILLFNGKCICSLGYYQPSSGNTQICRACSQAIQGCLQCSSEVSCTQCLKSGFCSLISPTDCNCTNAGLPICSGVNQRYDLVQQKCLCLKQFFYNKTVDQCQPCADPCFSCQFNSTFCFQCVQGYILLNHDCSFYQYSQFIVKGVPNYHMQLSRCISYSFEGFCFQQCQNLPNKLFYNSNCFDHCPVGTFAISHPQHFCQQCPIACLQCANAYQCVKCPTYLLYLNQSTLTCVHCQYGCAICKNSTFCIQCLESKSPSYNNTAYTSTCIQTFQPFTNLSCPIACAFCFIDTICQQCSENYFLTSDFKCLQCLSQLGLKSVTLQTSAQLDGYYSTYKKCIQVCGDGILINDQCDDGNIRSGDGCSQQCKIEQGFLCKYVRIQSANNITISSYSLCYSQNYSITYKIFRSLTNNSVIVQLQSIGISIGRLPIIQPKCSFETKELQILQQSTQSIKYIISHSQQLLRGSGQLHHCQFWYQNITNLTFSVLTFPNAATINYEDPFLSTILTLFNYLGKPSLYLTLFISVIGFTPYNIWVMLYSINLYSLSLYNPYNQPPAVYIAQDTFKYFMFTYDYHKEGTIINPQVNTLSWALLKILVYQIIIVVCYEILVGCLLGKAIDSHNSQFQSQIGQRKKLQRSNSNVSKRQKDKPYSSSKLIYVFQRIRQNRFLLYYSIHISYQLVANLFVFNVIVDLFQWIISQDQSQQFNYLGVICGSIHLLISIVVPIAIYFLVLSKKLDNMAFKTKMNGQDHKYFLLYAICKAVNIIFPLSVLLSTKQTSYSSYMLLWTTFFIILLIVINCKSNSNSIRINSIRSKQNDQSRQFAVTQELFKNYAISKKIQQQEQPQQLKLLQDQKLIIEKHNKMFYFLTHLHVILMMLVVLSISCAQIVTHVISTHGAIIADSTLIIEASSISGTLILFLSFILITCNWAACLLFLLYRLRIWFKEKEQLNSKHQAFKIQNNHNHQKISLEKQRNQQSSALNQYINNSLRNQNSKDNFIFYEQQEDQNDFNMKPISKKKGFIHQRQKRNGINKRDGGPNNAGKIGAWSNNNQSSSILTFQMLKKLNGNK